MHSEIFKEYIPWSFKITINIYSNASTPFDLEIADLSHFSLKNITRVLVIILVLMDTVTYHPDPFSLSC